MLKRVIIKLSGEALSGHKQGGFCDETIGGIARQVAEVVTQGTEVSLIVGGGNFWRGRSADSTMDRVKADQIGMLATVMNALYLSEAFQLQGQGVPSTVMTPIPIGNMTTLFHKDTALDMMRNGKVIFHAAGLGHPYFSTDTVTALRALELEADCVLYTKNGVGGVYAQNPQDFPDAALYKRLPYATAIAKQLQFADASALQLLQEGQMPSLVFGLAEPNGIVRACATDLNAERDAPLAFGTYLHNHIKEEMY